MRKLPALIANLWLIGLLIFITFFLDKFGSKPSWWDTFLPVLTIITVAMLVYKTIKGLFSKES